MNPIDTLLAIEGVKRCKAEYFRCIDEQDWDALVANFTPDAETDMREAVEPHNPDLLSHDPRAFAANNAYVLAQVKTAHFGYMPRIDVLSPPRRRRSGRWRTGSGYPRAIPSCPPAGCTAGAIMPIATPRSATAG
ncbi:nuclear transport factor 2 family protein [Rhizorhabdus histidinilytica]